MFASKPCEVAPEVVGQSLLALDLDHRFGVGLGTSCRFIVAAATRCREKEQETRPRQDAAEDTDERCNANRMENR